jgi:nucleotide-binding universal stress UspA family protein/N-acetylglutamate synthase-like GNAT family acetyltransferase
VERCPEIPGVTEVVLIHVATSRENHELEMNHGADGPELAAVRQRLEKDRLFLESQGIRAIAVIEPSHHPAIARTILDVADRTKADLILIGARGAGKVREALLGSVAHDVIRGARQHVLIMHPIAFGKNQPAGTTACPLLFSKILCPVDLSRMSDATVAGLQELAGRSRVLLLHAITAAESATQLNLLRRRATQRLEVLRETLGARKIPAEIDIRMGDPVLLSCTLAEREDASLILLSRYGRFDYMKNVPIGKTAEAIALRATKPVLIRADRVPLDVTVRQISPEEFYLAEQVWTGYHGQKADRTTDRIFAVFVEGTIAGVARCKRHPDGIEVDGVFVSAEFRDRGYARRVMQELVRERGHEPLYMHATLELVSFYRTFGFEPIPEADLPPTIRERFSFAAGNMEGSDVCPMRRMPPHAAAR